MKFSRRLFSFCLLFASHTAFADEHGRESYIGKLAPELTQCHVIDGGNLQTGSKGYVEGYVLAECDRENTKDRSIRIWRIGRSASQINSQNKISGEIILSWKPIKWNDYALASCMEKNHEEYNAGVYIRMGDAGALEENDKNALAFFATRDNGAIEEIPYSRIAECEIFRE